MEIIPTIKYIYPTLEFWVDYMADDWIITSWFNTEITQPTQTELETACVSLQSLIIKKADIKAFCDAYNLVSNISYKLADCNENINNQWCTLANKAIIQMQIDDFELRLEVAETSRDTLLFAWIAAHTDWSNEQRIALVQEFNSALIN